jgi:hypothetical protein
MLRFDHSLHPARGLPDGRVFFGPQRAGLPTKGLRITDPLSGLKLKHFALFLFRRLFTLAFA